MSTDPDDPRLPDALRADLAELHGGRPAASADVDRMILSSARAHFARRKRQGLLLRLGGAAAAVAAVVVVAVTIARTDRDHAAGPQVAADVSRLTGDANGDNLVNIRDALALARKVDAKQATWTRWDDVNGDRQIDRKDVEAIAMIAVRLDASGGGTR